MSEEMISFDKYRLKANGSFAIREGWLSKGIRHVTQDAEVFLRDDAPVILGVGSAMAKSMRYWLQATGLTIEPRSGKRLQTLTELGKLLYQNDPYFEDLFSLYAVHHHLVTDYQNVTVWYLLFNELDALRFSRETMAEALLAAFRQHVVGDFSVKSFMDDCNTALHTYIVSEGKQSSPEDNLVCPLASLDLFGVLTKGVYERTTPSTAKLHALTVLYIMLQQMNGRESIPFDKLLNESCNVGKVLHLTPYRLNCYLDELQAGGYIKLVRTAGLNIVHPTPGQSAMDVAKIYYGRTKR